MTRDLRDDDLDRAERRYRLLLKAYPPTFRKAYGDDAAELFRDRFREAHEASGTRGVFAFWLKTLLNIALHGPLERLDEMRGRPRSSRAPFRAIAQATRSLRRSPGLTGTIVVTLAMGIGSTVALFSVLNGVLLRPLPFFEPDRLVRIWETNPEVDNALHGPSPWNFADWDALDPGFESMTSWYLTSGTHRTEDRVEEVRSAQVTADFFRVLGVQPALGRGFQPNEVVRYGPVVLSDRLWRRLYGADPAIIGKQILTSGNYYEVVGVMPPDFSFPDETVEAWIAWNLPNVYDDRREARTWRFMEGLGRLADGTSLAEAEQELGAVAASLAEIYPVENRGWGVTLRSLHDTLVGDVRAVLWLTFGAVLFILLIACTNVANLLLARVPIRARALAIRQTLGAPRGRLLAELAVENLVLAVMGGALGLAFGIGLLRLLILLDAGRIPRLGEVSLDLRVLAFAFAASVITAVVFGVAPALQALRVSHTTLGSGTRTTGTSGQRRLREGFVAGQVAVALVLLAGAGLFWGSFQAVRGVNAGFNPENVATFRISLDPVEGTAEEIVRYYDGLLTKLNDLPGVVSVGAAQTLPLNPIGNDFQRPFRAGGTETPSGDASGAQMRIVTPGYRSAMGMTLVSGSDFSGAEGLDEPLVALVNRTLAEHLWPAGDAVGQYVDVDFREGWQPYRILAVVEDVRHYGPREEVRPEVYVSSRQSPYLAMNVVVRTNGAPAESMAALRETVLAHTPIQPAHNFVTLNQLRGASMAEERFLLGILGLFSGIALLLACAGVYGVTSYAMSQRRREIGLRMALGARAETVVGQVLFPAMGMTLVGLGGGLAVVILLSRSMTRLLFNVEPTDPLTLAAVVALLSAAAALAAYIPARRASQVEPVVALTAE